MPDVPDYTQSVSIDASSVTIPVSGSVSIASGSVTIANASIAVINATGTKITSARPPTELLATATAPSTTTTTTTATLPADIQALVVVLPNDLSRYVHLKIEWTPTGSQLLWVPLELFHFSQQVYVIPVAPFTRDGSVVQVSTLNVTIQASAAGSAAVEILGLYESNPLWLEFFAPPFTAPNQVPIFTAKSLASGVAQWLITPVVNIRITIFDFTLSYFTNAGAGDQWYVAHGPALPGAGVFPANAAVLASGGTAGAWPFNYPLGGSELPRGDGIYAEVTLSGAANFGSVITSSLD